MDTIVTEVIKHHMIISHCPCRPKFIEPLIDLLLFNNLNIKHQVQLHALSTEFDPLIYIHRFMHYNLLNG